MSEPFDALPVAPAGAAGDGITPGEAAKVLPVAPQSLQANPARDGVHLSWSATGEDVSSFVCLRRTGGGGWEEIGVVAAQPNQATYAFVDRAARAGATYVYGVQATRPGGVRSTVTQGALVTAS